MMDGESGPVPLADLAGCVIGLARQGSITLATAESCTGGALASLLADVPGAGEVFHGGYVVYTKANKTASLGVPADLIQAHSAVSAEVAQAMAAGALERSPADVTIAVTGVAGPEPDEDCNPVGLVYIAAATRRGEALCEHYRFPPGAKREIFDKILAASLNLLRAVLAGKAGTPGERQLAQAERAQ